MSEFRLAKEFKNRKIKLFSRQEIEPQEIFLDKLAQKKEEELGISGKKFEVPLSKKIIKGLFLIFLIIISVFLIKSFKMQILENKNFVAKAKENKFIIKSLEASRGVIYDSKGLQLVFNRPGFNLIVDKRNLPKTDEEKEKIFQAVSQITNQNVQDIGEKIKKSEESIILISENLDHQTLILLETKINNLPGFEIQRNSVREYKDGEVFSHLLGYLGRINSEEAKKSPDIYSLIDYVGRDGIEKSYEEFLRKNPGKLRIERDALGNIISKEIVSLPESGSSLVLWLDSELQKKIAVELEKAIKETGAKSGAAVALNPKNGGVVALVSLPSFDNNLFNKGTDPKALKNLLEDPTHPLYNRVVSAQFSTGSIIKPLIASAALEEKIISPLKEIECHGKITIPHKYNPEIEYEYKDWRTHGLTNMRKAIAESCNVYFYTIGGGYNGQEGLGPQRIKKYLEEFGWGKKTQIDLPGENDGFIPSPQWKKETKEENWWDGDTYNLSIGQGGLGVTLIQVVNSFSAIANGGTLYQPKTVKKIINDSGEKEIAPEILSENFIDSANLQIIREGMRRAVTGEGSPQATAILLNSLSVKAAAKTGTAETPKNDYYNKWITVFAPYDDPQIVLTIIIEDVKGEQITVIPIAKEILNWYFSL